MEISNKFKTSYLFDKEIVRDDLKLKSKPKDEFKIDFNEFKRIEYNGLITYTFILKRTANKDNDITENLIIEKRGDEIKGYIIKYSEASYFEKDNHKYLRAKISKTSYKGNIEDLLKKADSDLLPNAPAACIPEIVASVRVCSVHGAYSQDTACINFINQTYWDFTIIPCSTDGFGIGDFTDFDGGGDYNGGGENGNGTGFTTPIFPCGDSVHGCDKDAVGYILHYVEGLTPNQKNWVDNNYFIAKDMQTFLTNEQNSYEAQTFVKEAIDFLTSNSQFDFLQYENWFNGESEGQDFLYDANYWNNPSLSFPQQSLPSWNSFFNSYPRNSSGQWLTGANNVFSFVGGDVYKARQDYPNATNNTCALKVSIALNGAGINIPQITTTNGNPGTLKGADGKYYFLNAKSLNKWMRKTFGTGQNYSHYTAAQGGVKGKNFPSLLSGKKGIYSLVSTNPNWASGHADILLGNTTCAAGCHFGDAPIDYIDVWELK